MSKLISSLISMDKKYKTRDGRDVRVVCTDNIDGGVWTGIWTVVAIVDGEVCLYTKDGIHSINFEETGYDLVEVAQEYHVWVELFKSHGDVISCSYESESAMRNSINDSFESNDKEGYQLIATKKITVAEGEFCS